MLELENVILFDGICLWIEETLELQKELNMYVTSDDLRKKCGDLLDEDIPNGMLIAAMINLGYDCKQCDRIVNKNNPNAIFNVNLDNYVKNLLEFKKFNYKKE